jgi:protein SCO1
MTLRRFALIGLVLSVLSAACGTAKHYEMKGQVLSVNRDQQEILVKHEEIPGFMMAMTMPYKVQSNGMLDNLGAGDLINARLEVKNNAAVITAITKTGNAPPDLPPPAPVATAGFIQMLRNGDEVPNQPFVDEDGKARTFTDIRDGRAMALTFMYTKCPMPTYCPMMDRNFADVQKQIKANPALQGKVRLLSVSFDPKNDTPRVLKKHAKELGADPAVWTFVTADQDAVDRFAMSLGLTLIRGQSPNPDEIGHTLRTAIIDRDGKLVKTYTGNEWTPDQIVADLEKLP